MSLQLKFVVGLAFVATIGMVTENAQAQLFRSNNCVCQPVVVRPACPVYYTNVQPVYTAPLAMPAYETALPYESAMEVGFGISNEGFDLAPGETLISASPIDSQGATETVLDSTSVVNGVLEPQVVDTIQTSVSDLPASTVEPVPSADTTIVSPAKPTEAKPAAETPAADAPKTEAPKTEATPAAEPAKAEPTKATQTTTTGDKSVLDSGT